MSVNLIKSLHQVAKQKLWLDAMHYTKELLKENKVVEWSLKQSASAIYHEWQAGNPYSWKVSECSVVHWKIMSMPSPAKRIGNSWTGGTQTTIDPGSNITVTATQAARFIEDLKQLEK